MASAFVHNFLIHSLWAFPHIASLRFYDNQYGSDASTREKSGFLAAIVCIVLMLYSGLTRRIDFSASHYFPSMFLRFNEL
jgi:hypothetical protein